MLADRWGRKITYLRISVTDRCNLRCVYCMPPESLSFRPRADIMRFEEIVTVARLAAEYGVRRVRLTGGEPLARRDLPNLVSMLATISQIEEISLTTNGTLLEEMAPALKEAGLGRINVSLDTLQEDKFACITRGGSLRRVWRGLEAAERAGLVPIKINVVAMRGVNDDELADLARLVIDHPWHVRFIELMPIKNVQAWGTGFPSSRQAYLPVKEIMQELAPFDLVPVIESSGDGPAREFTIKGARGRLGFISPVSEHFCQRCNRLRITADGCFRSCLLRDEEVPFLTVLRAGRPVLPLLQKAVSLKPAGHSLQDDQALNGRCMVQIGG